MKQNAMVIGKVWAIVLFVLSLGFGDGVGFKQANAAATTSIKGQIHLGKGLSAPNGAIIFISARPPGGGRPLAAMKIESPKFPVSFELGKEHMMMGGEFQGEVDLTVRLTQSGDAMKRTAGDLFGRLRTKVGDQMVKIQLDQKI